MSRKTRQRGEEGASGATAEAPIGRGLQRSQRKAFFGASQLTRGPWHPDHQHAGPPSALICRAIERAAAGEGLTHLGRLTVNLLRPAPVGECRVEVAADYVGRNAGHYSGRLMAQGKESARFTALMQREEDMPVPEGNSWLPAAGGAEAA